MIERFYREGSKVFSILRLKNFTAENAKKQSLSCIRNLYYVLISQSRQDAKCTTKLCVFAPLRDFLKHKIGENLWNLCQTFPANYFYQRTFKKNECQLLKSVFQKPQKQITFKNPRQSAQSATSAFQN